MPKRRCTSSLFGGHPGPRDCARALPWSPLPWSRCTGDEVHSFQSLEREALGGAGGDIDQELRRAPPLVLVGVDVERRAADLSELQVVGSGRQFAVLEAQRRGSITAAA